jgi:hypothetical protein
VPELQWNNHRLRKNGSPVAFDGFLMKVLEGAIYAARSFDDYYRRRRRRKK